VQSVSATGIIMKLWIFIFIGLLITKTALAAPDMLSIAIGTEFPDKSPFNNQSSEKPRPTLQFLVPNSGESKELFPEYEVAILRSTNEISIISGRSVFSNMPACEKNKVVAVKWVTKIIPNAKLNPQNRVYSSESSNVFATLSCSYRDSSPYPMLELQFRGKEQDKKLEAAWESFFQKH
jgi:hypothetical protein